MSAALASFYKCSAYVDNKVLGAGVAEDITKPAGYNSCIITPNADIWMRRGGAAAVPVADVADGTGSILIPAGQSRIVDFLPELPSGTALASVSVLCAGACEVSIEWFA